MTKKNMAEVANTVTKLLDNAMAWWLEHEETILTIAMVAGLLVLLTRSSHG